MEALSFLFQILPPVTVVGLILVWLFLKYWGQLKEIANDALHLYSRIKRAKELFTLNRGYRKSRKENETQPLTQGIEESVVLLQFQFDPECQGKLELKGNNRAIAYIPRFDVQSIVRWTRKHLHENVMPMFFIKDVEKLRKAIELVYLKMTVDALGFDGSYSLAIHNILTCEFGQQPQIEKLFNALIRVNEDLKSKQWMDRRILRIILLETYRMVLGVKGGD
jgi:hypothetical protein